MDLYLVRHAIAHDRDAKGWPDDSKRPLTPEGARRFRRAARGLARLVPHVELVLASPFRRAWQTAEILSEEARWPAPVSCRELEAGRPVAAVLKAIAPHAELDSIALVGHEPGLHELVSYLAAGRRDAVVVEMKKGAVACLRFEGAPRAGAGTMRLLLQPKVLLELEV